MKILHITPSYIPAYSHGGPVVSVHILNRWLVKLGVDVTVYTTNVDGNKKLDVPLNKEVNIDGVKVFYFPLSFRAWEYSRAMHHAIAENIKNFDIIHITSVFLSASTLGAYYVRKYKKPFIISPRGNFMKQTYGSKSLKKEVYTHLIEKFALKSASAIHFTSEAEKCDYIETKLPFRKALIIPNPFESENIDPVENNLFRNKWGIKEDVGIILFIGRLNWVKGFDTLIPAFAEVLKKNQKVRLVIAGPDEAGYKKNIQLLITNYQLQDSVIFTGLISGKEKKAVLRESSVFVLPSFSESFSMATIEAMAAEKPVVITKGVGISSEVEKVGAGIVVEKDVNQVADAILKVLSNPDLAKKMGENGRKLAKEEFSPEKIAEKWVKEYDKIINA